MIAFLARPTPINLQKPRLRREGGWDTFSQPTRCGRYGEVRSASAEPAEIHRRVGKEGCAHLLHQPRSRPWRSCRTSCVIRSMSFMTEAFSSWLLMLNAAPAAGKDR